MNDFFKRKWLITFFIFCGISLVLLIFKYGKLSSQPVQPIAKSYPKVERGSIVDRSGAPLAVDTNFYHVGVSLKSLRDDNQATLFAQDVAPILDMTVDSILDLLDTNRSFVYLRKKVDSTTYDSLKELTDKKHYNFVSYEKIPGRNYPNHSLASQVVGYMGDDGKGLAGIEFSQQDILSPTLTEDNIDNPYGQDIYLTIDSNLQYKLEEIANRTMENTQAESMMLIAADSRSGEILSYISLPAADLNEYGNSAPEEKIDRPAMYAYEPGSVFKIFTVAIAYEEQKLSPNDTFICDGMYEKRLKSGETVKIKCLDHHGTLTAKDALRYSCNDVIGQISDRIDTDHFLARIRMLGFGEKTGIELPGETAGSVKDTSSRLWSARSQPTIAIGQEISVSALQMVQAATAIANNGTPVKLSLINKITNKDGSVAYEHTPEFKDPVFSPRTADYVLSCMETTAKTGTGHRANLGDVDIGVKTGTAQMADKENGGYSDTDFLSNCIAIFPVDDPQIVLYIVVEKAKGETYAGRIVAPVIKEAADVIIDHLGMSRGKAASLEHSGVITISKTQDLKIEDTVPDFTGRSKKELLPLIETPNINLNINGSGWVTSQNPEPGTPVTENMVIELYLE